MDGWPFVKVAEDLDAVGLLWKPEIGDEVSERGKLETVSILVAPDGMTPRELRQKFLWLPTIEQLISQLEARQAILFHTGLELSTGACVYKTVLRANTGNIECVGNSMRSAIGLALKDLIVRQSGCTGMH